MLMVFWLVLIAASFFVSEQVLKRLDLL